MLQSLDNGKTNAHFHGRTLNCHRMKLWMKSAWVFQSMGMLALHVNWLEYYLENELRVNHLRDFGVTPGNGNTVTGFIWPQKNYQVTRLVNILTEMMMRTTTTMIKILTMILINCMQFKWREIELIRYVLQPYECKCVHAYWLIDIRLETIRDQTF